MSAIRRVISLTLRTGSSWNPQVPYPGRAYSAIVGVTYDCAGQPTKIRVSDSAAVPADPNQCKWTPIESIDAERLDASLVHKLRYEVFGENTRFFKIEF